MDDWLAQQIDAHRDYGKAVCRQIGERMVRLGFAVQSNLSLPQFDAAEFSAVTDPYTQSRHLIGYWYNAKRQRIGQIQFLADGSFYAEYDVLQAHPGKKQWFVEAITAWGSEQAIKTEAKLLEALSE